MWSYKLMLEMDEETAKKVKKYAAISGWFFIALGLIGLIFPVFMSFSTLIMVAYTMIVMGVIAGWLTFKSNPKDWAGWLKSFVLFMVGVLMLVYPMHGIAAIGLLFVIYFFTDAFASFGLLFSHKPEKGWWLWLINALASLALGVIVLIGWPFNSLVIVGLLVGISFLLDGVALIVGSKALDTKL